MTNDRYRVQKQIIKTMSITIIITKKKKKKDNV